MVNSYAKQLQRHEAYAAANGALLVLIAIAGKYGVDVLKMLPGEADFNQFRYMVYGIWAVHLGLLIVFQKLFRNSRRAMLARS